MEFVVAVEEKTNQPVLLAQLKSEQLTDDIDSLIRSTIRHGITYDVRVISLSEKRVAMLQEQIACPHDINHDDDWRWLFDKAESMTLQDWLN